MAKAKAAPLDEKWIRRVREILDEREYRREPGRSRDLDSDWTIGALLALPIPYEETARICGKQLGSAHRTRYAHLFWAALPGIAPADDSLRRSFSSKAEGRPSYAMSAVAEGGRCDFDAEVAEAIAAEGIIGTTQGDAAVHAAQGLGTRATLAALVALTKKVKKLEAASSWLCAWTVLRALTGHENPKEAEPFLRRYCPTLASDAKPHRFDPEDHTTEAAVSLGRMGDRAALEWLAAYAEREQHAWPLCSALGWAFERDRDADVLARWREHARGEETKPFLPRLRRRETAPADATIAELDAAIAKKPEDRAARHQRGNLCFDAGSFHRAMHDYAACMRLDERIDDEVPLRRWLARAALRLKPFADVELRRWIFANGERLDPPRLRLARHVAGFTGIDDATSAAETPEDRIEAWFFAGARALFLGEEETGRRALERCLSAVTRTPSPEQISARALLESSRSAGA